MKRFICLASSILIVASFSACVSKNADASRLVPSDAYAALLAESPLELLKSADSFFKAADLERVTKGKTLIEALREYSEKNKSLKDAAAALDFSRPFAFVLVPDRSGQEPQAAAVLWLPLKSDPDSFGRLRKSLDDFDGSVDFVDGYAALCLKGPAPSSLPIRKADLSRLARYPADSVKAWVNMESLRADFGGEWPAAVKGAFETPAEEDSSPDSDAPYDYNERNFDWDEYYRKNEGPGLLSSGMAGGAFDFESLLEKAAENVRTLDFAVILRENGAQLRAGASVPDDRALGKLAAAAGSSRGLPYLKYVESDALIGAASSLDPSALSPFMKTYFEAFGLKESLGEKYFELLDASYSAQGPDSALSFGVSIDPDFQQKAGRAQSPQEIQYLIENSFTLNLSGVDSLRDVDSYRAALRLLAEKGVFGETFENLLDSAGMDFKILVEKEAAGDAECDAVRFALGGAAVEASPETKAVLDAVLDKLAVYVGYKDDKAYMVMGDPGLLVERMKADGASDPISEDRRYRDFAAALPKSTKAVFYLSLRHILDIISPFVPDLPAGSLEDFDRLYGYFAAQKGSLETGVFLGSRDIKGLIGLAKGALPEGEPEL